jgi:polyribonucleotide nucleotidyltransferase
MLNPVIKTFTYGHQQVTLETSRIARQADGAVLVTIGKTQVLCTVVAARKAKPGQDFFPLSVHYQERSYAAGKIPGGYIKREGRPSEKETLTSRLIDRPIRPLFPEGFVNEVQVICTVMSSDNNVDPDIAAMLGTSAALAVSGIPFNGPIGAARVGLDDEQGYLLNPNYDVLKTSLLDMVVAGTKDAVLMVESEAQELTEDEMLGAVLFAHQEMQVAIDAINAFVSEVGVETWQWQAPEINGALYQAVKEIAQTELAAAYQVAEKQERYSKIEVIKDKTLETLAGEEEGKADAEEVNELFSKLKKEIVRERILSGQPRIDGRDNRTVRGLDIQTNLIQRAHGSSLFTRGETQAIVTCTLGSSRDMQDIDTLHGGIKERFMLHYNFPPYSVGECGRIGAVGRREVGHGRLARRGVQAVLPTAEEFPYTIRVVSEITESNGSSSMASVCGASLAMMDAGVPLVAPVAGIAMGLIKEQDRFAVITDILGDEDHLGDMDFKVAGTSEGITALQMDIKIEGINEEIMDTALKQAQEARLHILDAMNTVVGSHRSELAEHAPRISVVRIDPEKISELIGKGGATIRGITEETGVEIDIQDTGEVKIFAADGIAASRARHLVESITSDAEVGKIYEGKIVRIVDFGAFVSIMPGKEGLLHISQISDQRINAVTDVLKENQILNVKVLDVDNRGRIKLSMKNIEQPA